MSVLGISGPPPLPPPVVSERDKSDRRVVVIVIVLVVVVIVGAIGALIAVTTYYTRKYGNIDRSHESLSWDPDLAHATSTTFESPAYGVTLKLPGKWDSMREAPNDICHLRRADRGFNVLVRPYFPSFAPPRAVAAQVVNGLRSQGWTFKSEDSITVSGLPADEIRFVSLKGIEVNELVVGKPPLTYYVVLSAPASDADGWQKLDDALPQALTIR